MNKVMEGGGSQNGHQALYDHPINLHGENFWFVDFFNQEELNVRKTSYWFYK